MFALTRRVRFIRPVLHVRTLPICFASPSPSLLQIRCIFRVIEFAQGYSGYLRTTEWCLFALDYLPILCAISIWTVVWPPRVFARFEDVLISQGGEGSHMGLAVRERGEEREGSMKLV
jgi:hypothetical protein